MNSFIFRKTVQYTIAVGENFKMSTMCLQRRTLSALLKND